MAGEGSVSMSCSIEPEDGISRMGMTGSKRFGAKDGDMRKCHSECGYKYRWCYWYASHLLVQICIQVVWSLSLSDD